MQQSYCPAIGKSLIKWYVSHGRELPWRKEHLPYQIWISEIMLQQTQVSTMLPYYHRWIERFPNIVSVAAASEEELLKHWEGLGYYSRVRNIARTARILCTNHGGNIPSDHDAILNLPGIGPYTAGAVMSLAFNRDYPAVDGNVERILARLLDIDTPVKERTSRERIWKTVRDLLPTGDARRFNQALMDLGAAVCLPGKPFCAHCPLNGFCLGFERGVEAERPVRPKRRKAAAIDVAVAILMRADRIFIQKRPPSGLMPNLWEFPGGKVAPGEAPTEALMRELREELGVDVCNLRKMASIKHSYTSFRVALHAYTCTLRDKASQPEIRAAVEGRWVTRRELENFAFPSANRRLIALLLEENSAAPKG